MRDVFAGMQEFLQQEQVLTENATVIEAPDDNVVNAVQNNQQQFNTHIQQIKAMMQAMQL